MANRNLWVQLVLVYRTFQIRYLRLMTFLEDFDRSVVAVVVDVAANKLVPINVVVIAIVDAVVVNSKCKHHHVFGV